MQRRDFLRLGAKKAAEVAGQMASQRLAWQAESWLRPPFAQTELEFLLACTRCDSCVEACDFDVLFKLPANLGPSVAGTPAMDLLNRGCHLCEDWPCVRACEPEALTLPHRDNGAPPPAAKLAGARINPDTCLPYAGPECGACAHSCPDRSFHCVWAHAKCASASWAVTRRWPAVWLEKSATRSRRSVCSNQAAKKEGASMT